MEDARVELIRFHVEHRSSKFWQGYEPDTEDSDSGDPEHSDILMDWSHHRVQDMILEMD